MKIRKQLLGVLLCAVLCFTAIAPLSCFASSQEENSWAASWSTSPVNTGYYVGSRVFSDFLLNDFGFTQNK